MNKMEGDGFDQYIRGALHKIGRFRNVPTVGTFVNEFNFNLLINVPMVGTFRKRLILCNAPQAQGCINP